MTVLSLQWLRSGVYSNWGQQWLRSGVYSNYLRSGVTIWGLRWLRSAVTEVCSNYLRSAVTVWGPQWQVCSNCLRSAVTEVCSNYLRSTGLSEVCDPSKHYLELLCQDCTAAAFSSSLFCIFPVEYVKCLMGSGQLKFMSSSGHWAMKTL